MHGNLPTGGVGRQQRYVEVDELESDGGTSIIIQPNPHTVLRRGDVPLDSGNNRTRNQVPLDNANSLNHRTHQPSKKLQLNSNRHAVDDNSLRAPSILHQHQAGPPLDENSQADRFSNQDTRHAENGEVHQRVNTSVHQRRERVASEQSLLQQAPPPSRQHNPHRMHSMAPPSHGTSKYQDERSNFYHQEDGYIKDISERRFGADIYRNHHLPVASNDYRHYDYPRDDYLREYQHSRQSPGPPPLLGYQNPHPWVQIHGSDYSGPSNNTRKPPSRSTDYDPTSNHPRGPVRPREEERQEEPRAHKKRKIELENDYRPMMPLPARGQASNPRTLPPAEFQPAQQSFYPPPSTTQYCAIAGPSRRPNHQNEKEFHYGTRNNYHDNY